MISLSYLFEFDEDQIKLVNKLLKKHIDTNTDKEYPEKEKIIKDVFKKYTSKKDLEDLSGGINYGNVQSPETGRYDTDNKSINISHTVPKNELRDVTAHELSHHVDRENSTKEEKPSLMKFNDYLSHPAEFVARGGVSHIRNQEADHQYWPEGQPSLKKQIVNLRSAAKRLSPEDRMIAHHNNPYIEKEALNSRKNYQEAQDILRKKGIIK